MFLYIRFNAQEANFAEKVNSLFPGFVIDGPILEYYKAKFTQVLVRTKKEFIVDPHTFDFTSEKRSHNLYSQKIGGKIDIHELSDEDRTIFTTAAIAFQENRINEVIEEDPIDEISDKFYPLFLVPPYDVINEIGNITSNISFIIETRKIRPTAKIYAALLLSKELLIQKKSLLEILQVYLKQNVDGYCFSVDSFDAYADAQEYLEGYKFLIEELAKNGKPIISLHGSFYDILLGKSILHAIVHGVDSGDILRLHKPQFGRRQFTRLYIPKLHKRYSGAELDYIKKNAPELIECSCGFCKKDMKREDEIIHYIACRTMEINGAKSSNQLEELKATYIIYNKKILLALYVKYLERWINVLTK